jgi:antitoxin HicB
MKYEYPYSIEKDESGGYVVQFIDIEEAFTQGNDLEEVAYNASEVLTGIILYRLDNAQDVPEPSDITGENIHYAKTTRSSGFCSRQALGITI